MTPSKIKFEQELNTIPENFPEVPDFLQIKDEVESVFDFGAAKIPTNDVDKDVYNIILCYNIRNFSNFFCINDAKLYIEMKIRKKISHMWTGDFKLLLCGEVNQCKIGLSDHTDVHTDNLNTIMHHEIKHEYLGDLKYLVLNLRNQVRKWPFEYIWVQHSIYPGQVIKSVYPRL